MSRIAIAAAVSVLAAAAGAAQAQSIGATGATSATLTYDASVNGTTNYGDGIEEATHAIVVGPRGAKVTYGGSFEAIVDINESHVSFESGVAVSGPFSKATSFSGVDVTVTNLSEVPVSIANFGSTIIPAGLGFYLQDRSGGATDNNVFTGYGQTNDGSTFKDLTSLSGTGIENPFAYADFDFTVSRQYDEGALYSLSGWISLYLDEQGNVQTGFGLSDAALALSGFTGVHGTPTDPFDPQDPFDANNAFAYGFAWDATDIMIPLDALLGYEQSETLLYRTSVNATTYTNCITPTTCLVAYSGFGDPIGRGGGIASFARGAQSFGPNEPTGPITGIVFDPVQFDPFQLIPGGGAVPEPATWLSMILGFGLLGSTLRRRRLTPAVI